MELAELLQDPAFRRRARALAQYSAAQVGPGGAGEDATLDATGFAVRVAERAGAALRRGVDPASAEAA